MTAGTWYADVDFITTSPVSSDEAESVAETLAEHGGAVSISADGKAGAISIAFEADSVEDASRIATRIATDNLGGHGRLDVVKLDVRNEAVMEKEIATPVIPELVGYAEIAELAGVSRQRARQFADIPGFPAPVVETAAGPLRTRAAIDAWLAHRNTSPGRRRVNA
ncbi:hypothetical protein [Georgenia satyanarayanai]|uniref:hypothetical protein n=1 Tax=Georgenia satyanarayanai TaxID=860221 RepID=UPI0012644DBE|nr:hypothetical protein [Georgenia satyanarayanai]